MTVMGMISGIRDNVRYVRSKEDIYTLLIGYVPKGANKEEKESLTVMFELADDINCKLENSKKVTGRDFSDYMKYNDQIPINPNYQYVEVGAGIGGFVPHLVKKFSDKLIYKPIIIDPVNYQILKNKLEYGYHITEDKNHKKRIRTLVDRCDIILDPNKVKLINTTLQEAVFLHPSLESSADVLIDLCGPAIYNKSRAKKYEKFIAKSEESMFII